MLNDEYNMNRLARNNKMRSSLEAYLNNWRKGTGEAMAPFGLACSIKLDGYLRCYIITSSTQDDTRLNVVPSALL